MTEGDNMGDSTMEENARRALFGFGAGARGRMHCIYRPGCQGPTSLARNSRRGQDGRLTDSQEITNNIQAIQAEPLALDYRI
jgi:hypothetical protein